MPISVKMRFQINLMISRRTHSLEGLKQFLPHMTYPVFWFEMVCTLTSFVLGSVKLSSETPVMTLVLLTLVIRLFL